MYTVLKHVNSEYPSRRLTHLCIFDNGSLAKMPGRDSVEYKQKVFERAKKFAEELNFPLLKLESNFPVVVPQSHYLTHTYMDALMIYSLQKLWQVYYYGSSRSFNEFSLKKNMDTPPTFFEPFLLDCFSTSKLKIISSGSEGDRNDKIDFIADNPIAQKYLHVCLTHGETNCGGCEKCIRTLLAIDAANKLDNFRDAFNIDSYIKRRKNLYRYLNNRIKKNPSDSYLAKSYKVLYARHKEFFDSIIPETKTPSNVS